MDPRLMQAVVQQQPANVVGVPPSFNGINPFAAQFTQYAYPQPAIPYDYFMPPHMPFAFPPHAFGHFYHGMMPPQPPPTPPDPPATKKGDALAFTCRNSSPRRVRRQEEGSPARVAGYGRLLPGETWREEIDLVYL
eukprot:105129-Pleurochrysis_carterae.AAC.2